MKNLILRLVIAMLLLSGLMGYGFVDHATSAPSCTITTHSATVGNGTLSYNQVGAGRSILLLHGLFASKEQWNDMICQFAEVGYQAIAPDLPGYGNSNGFTVRDYA